MITELASSAVDHPERARRIGLWLAWRPWIIGLLAIGVGAALLHELRTLLAEVHYADIVAELKATPTGKVFYAFLATALSYFALSWYDASALRYVQVRLKRGTVLFTSFIAYALGNTIGLGVLTGGAVRMRLYSAAGVEPTKIAMMIAFNAGAFGLGIIVCGSVGMLWGASDVASLINGPEWLFRGVAAGILTFAFAFVLLCAIRREVRVARWRLQLPPVRLVLGQLAISIVDLIASAAALWVLLPSGSVGLPLFATFYVIGIAAGLLSHVPGGLGVFEGVILLAFSGHAPAEQVASALLLYRAIYYLAPLVLAATMLATYEMRGAAAPIGRAAVKLSPMFLAALTLIAGAMLVMSGVTPATNEASDLLALHVPLSLVEASHFLGSIAGIAMIFVARGLLVRLDAAWWAAVLLAVVAAVLTIPKGIALSEAGLLGVLALLLVISRRQFDRPSALFAVRLERGWWLSIALVLASCTWLLFFAYRDVDYGHQLWWQFEFDAHAPRSLRAIVGVALFVLLVALWQLLREPSGRASSPSAVDLERAALIVSRQDSADGGLALMGDKSLLFSTSDDAFIMFGKRGRSWVALFDPIGARSAWPDLIWRFIELSRAHGGRACFYEVPPQSLPLYIDAGLRAYKLGESAHVDLPRFTLQGSKRSNLRQSVNRAQREGLHLEVVPAEKVTKLLPELRAISDAWLSSQNTREKAFSLGSFQDDYVARQPVAIVRRSTVMIAFATVMTTSTKAEATVDLMRHIPGAPAGTMDFLFANLMLHLQSLGYQRFGLGMAPMSGMAMHELAPRWHRFGRLAFERGGRFYNFRGLRSFKQKFDPIWEPRYLAAPGGIAPLFVLADVAALIAGGVKGVVAK